MLRENYEIKSVIEYLLNLQKKITENIENIDDQAKFSSDKWERDEGGGGESKILRNGKIFEQAGVNFSHVRGKSLPPSAIKTRPNLVDKEYEATGLSLVIHPQNPFVPTTHANLRFFSAQDRGNEPVWWFGGGFDLTPYYPFHDDVVFWHKNAYEACKGFGDSYYPKFKTWCDEYFFLKHRNETRGIGGLFFDDFNELGFEKSLQFLHQLMFRMLLKLWRFYVSHLFFLSKFS